MVLTTTVEKSFPNFELGRWDRAFIYMMETLAGELEAQGIRLPTDKLTIVDVGAGSMIYGLALETWAYHRARQPRIIAVDPEYALPERKGLFLPPRASDGKSSIEQIACHIEDALPVLKELGIQKVDLVTLFNPSPLVPLPNLRSLDALCGEVPVIGAVHAPLEFSVNHLVSELASQGYKVITRTNHNSQYMRKYAHSFDPQFVALQKSSV